MSCDHFALGGDEEEDDEYKKRTRKKKKVWAAAESYLKKKINLGLLPGENPSDGAALESASNTV